MISPAMVRPAPKDDSKDNKASDGEGLDGTDCAMRSFKSIDPLKTAFTHANTNSTSPYAPVGFQ